MAAASISSTFPVASFKLQHYLRTFRKRSGLSQKELAFLLGCKCGTKVSRYERRVRLPNLRTLLAYSVIFRVPCQELLAGYFEDVKDQTLKRIELLTAELSDGKSNPLVTRKLEILSAAMRLNDEPTDEAISALV